MFRFERLLLMGELSASLAHESTKPLTSILSNARAAIRLMEAGGLEMAELKEILNDIAADDKRAGDVIRSLRSMVKVEEGDQEAAPVGELVSEAVVLFNSEAIIRNVKLEVDIGSFLPSVMVNRV
jgi:two-component system, LuxR family, sensor kinase FixL